MNNFDNGLGVLKKRCEGDKTITGEDAFREVAAEMEMPLEKLYFFLECLESLGLISYSLRNKTISITEKGSTTEKLYGEC